MQNLNPDDAYRSIDEEFERFIGKFDSEDVFDQVEREMLKNIFVAGLAAGFLFSLKILQSESSSAEAAATRFKTRGEEIKNYMERVQEKIEKQNG